MSRLLKSRYYLMKCLGLVLLLGFISFGVIGGCYNNGGGVSSQALTENDFANFPGLSADPEKHIIVNSLEHPDTGKPENDTGEVGNDTIPYTYTTTLNHTFCWEDDDIDAEHFMVLDDSEGNEILRIDVNGECVTELIAAGDYVMIIFHDGRIDTTHPVFIIPNRESNQQARETGGLINKFKETISRSLQNLQNKFVRDANAQTATPLQTLINTGKCIGCDLKGVDLSSIDLGHVDLTGADLSSANMRDSNFAGSNFTTANLSGANMVNSNFINAVFTSAKLGGSILGDSNGLAVFSFATWTDGKCKCGVRTFTTSLVINPLGGSGREPVSIAISPDASNVYVVDKDTNSVSVIATSLNQITQVVTVGSRPTSIALSPNGLKGYVTTSFDADRIWILETDPLVLVDLVMSSPRL